MSTIEKISESYDVTIQEILECARVLLSRIKPSEWAELNRMMTPDVSPIVGMLSYDNSPYTREIVDCFAADHPARIIAVMKGAQIGFSTTVIEAAIGWIISQNPGNILYLIGHEDLVDESMNKIDRMIDNSGLRHLIKATTNRKKNMKTGDTNRKKEFPAGNLIGGIANHKTLRNRSVQYGFIDDFEAMKSATKEAGDTTAMIEQRFAAYRQKMKLCYISTPELKERSNIESVFVLGDQRRYFIPCPCCGTFISLHWSIPSKKTENVLCGITWETLEGKVVKGSVGYKCQECEDVFTDKNKNDLLRLGKWQATAEPSREGYYSYHISSLYAPTYMYDWEDYVHKYLEANPPGQPRNEQKWQAFVNLVLGETYEPPGTSIESKSILVNNCRDYSIGVIPESLSVKDGNGRVVLLTCAADLGGRVAGLNSDYDDVRLDYEVVAHTESGSTYSITQGSIGTFRPAHMGERNPSDERWSYDITKPNNVWREFDRVLDTIYPTDTGRKMRIQICGIDTGFAEHQAFTYIDRRSGRFNIVGLKGDKEHKYIPFGDNTPSFKIGQSRSNLYILKVGKIKDRMAHRISLKWERHSGEQQPPGYLNFPKPSAGKYDVEGFFLHYESEERKLDKDRNFIWQKKTPQSQNHFWDCGVYNMELREILMNRIFRELKIDLKTATWQDFCALLTGGK